MKILMGMGKPSCETYNWKEAVCSVRCNLDYIYKPRRRASPDFHHECVFEWGVKGGSSGVRSWLVFFPASYAFYICYSSYGERA